MHIVYYKKQKNGKFFFESGGCQRLVKFSGDVNYLLIYQGNLFIIKKTTLGGKE